MTPASSTGSRWRVLLVALAAGLPLAGCIVGRDAVPALASVSPGHLTVDARWGDYESDPLPHLLLSLSHRLGDPVSVGPSATPIRVTGPVGGVPVVWSSMTGARALAGDDSVSLALHPRVAPDGNFSLSMDHAWGIPSPAPSGDYFVCIGSDCARATLR